MRRIDRYFADHTRYPRGFGALVTGGYIAQIPTDPFTNRADSWRTIEATDGVRDVRSASQATAPSPGAPSSMPSISFVSLDPCCRRWPAGSGRLPI